MPADRSIDLTLKAQQTVKKKPFISVTRKVSQRTSPSQYQRMRSPIITMSARCLPAFSVTSTDTISGIASEVPSGRK